jgi:hypothetical protein
MSETKELTLPEIDALVAEKIMGWTSHLDGIGVSFHRNVGGDFECMGILWRPTERWSDAGRVIERMRELGWLVYDMTECRTDGEVYFAFADTERRVSESCWIAGPFQRAICLAALAAVTGGRYSVREE